MPDVSCPFENLSLEREVIISTKSACPFHKKQHSDFEKSTLQKPIKVNIVHGTHTKTSDSARLLEDIGGGDRIREMTTRFYAYFIRDVHLRQFRFESDSPANHGQRLGDWIVQKMGGEGDVWSDSGRHDMRQVSHHHAWNSKNRAKKDLGIHFNLVDTIIWMRVMFLAGRDVGLDKHRVFWDWYLGFIRHFIAVYERSAPPHAQDAQDWSLNKDTVQEYINDGFKMKDIHVRND